MMGPDGFVRLLAPIKSRMYNIISRAVVAAMDNSGKTLKCQIVLFQNDTYDGVDVLQNYGFESLPDAADEDNEAVVLSIGGNLNMASATGVHNRALRPRDLAAGEAQVYSKHGQKVHLKADGSVVVTEAGGAVLTMKDGEFTLKGKVNLKDSGGKAVVLETIIDKLNNHLHACSVDAGTHVGSTTTMTAGGTTLMAGTDSAADVKAAT